MLLRNVDRESVTVYNRYGDTFIKTILHNCVWRGDYELNFKSQGNLPIDSAKIYVDNYEGYVNHKDYNGVGWTITLGSDKRNTYIIRGECSFNFDSDSINDSIREFESKYDYNRAEVVKENFMGTERSRHLMIIC